MKKLKLGSKLSIQKETIALLNEKQLSAVKGGGPTYQTTQPTVQGMGGCTGQSQITGCATFYATCGC